MLIATRTCEDAGEEVGLDWFVANRTVVGDPERWKTAEHVERRERVAARMAHRFTTDTFGGDLVAKLIGLQITREIPVRTTLWTIFGPMETAMDAAVLISGFSSPSIDGRLGARWWRGRARARAYRAFNKARLLRSPFFRR